MKTNDNYPPVGGGRRGMIHLERVSPPTPLHPLGIFDHKLPLYNLFIMNSDDGEGEGEGDGDRKYPNTAGSLMMPSSLLSLYSL